MKRILRPVKTALLMVGVGAVGYKAYTMFETYQRNMKAKMKEDDKWSFEFEDKDSVRDFISRMNSEIDEYGFCFVDRIAFFGWDTADITNIKVMSNGTKWVVRIPKPKYHK